MINFFYIFFLLIFNANADEVSRLLLEEDTDRDKKITVLDQGDRKFNISGKTIKGHYHLSNLLQELTLIKSSDKKKLDFSLIEENPVDRTSRMIRDFYWAGLTRKIDEENLAVVLPDSKTSSQGTNYLYVSPTDLETFSYFDSISKKKPELNLSVQKLPLIITPSYLKNLSGKHGLLALKPGVPYVVPGGRFNELYGWDSYFESLGLVLDGEENRMRALGMVKNFTYEIEHYGKILNANRTYYLLRSQPPFFTSMIRLLLKDEKQNPSWLEPALKAAIKEYETVWTGPDRLTETGLSRYFGSGEGIPPEVEEGHFNPIIKPYAEKAKLSVEKYAALYDEGKIKEPELDEFFMHDRCVRESGHDTTYRFRHDGKEACADFVTVDLNSLLYKYELDLAFLIHTYFKGNFQGKSTGYFLKNAKNRKALIRKYLLDEKSGYFFDYHLPSKKRSTYISATGLFPLFSGEEKILSTKEAKLLVNFALKHLEGPGGLYSTAKSSREAVNDKHERQWEWPNGWAPHQMMAWMGLLNYGFKEDAHRLIYKWLLMITENARDYNGTIPEKFDIQKRSHAVFAEYGNVGTEFDYITREGFGWMNGSYQFGLSLLPNELIQKLKKMGPAPK